MSNAAIRAALEAAERDVTIARAVGASDFEQICIAAWRILIATGHIETAERVRMVLKAFMAEEAARDG
jgi:hypothetical protein